MIRDEPSSSSPFLKAYFNLTGRDQHPVSKPASVCGIIPARRNTDQLHPLVDRCPAAAADLHIGGMLHGVARELFYQIQVTKDEIGFCGNTDADTGIQKLFQQGAGAAVLLFQRLVRVGHRAEKGFFARIFAGLPDLRPVFYVDELSLLLYAVES